MCDDFVVLIRDAHEGNVDVPEHVLHILMSLRDHAVHYTHAHTCQRLVMVMVTKRRKREG